MVNCMYQSEQESDCAQGQETVIVGNVHILLLVLLDAICISEHDRNKR